MGPLTPCYVSEKNNEPILRKLSNTMKTVVVNLNFTLSFQEMLSGLILESKGIRWV